MNRIEKARAFYDSKPYGYWNFDGALYTAMADYAESAVREFWRRYIERVQGQFEIDDYSSASDYVFREMFGKELDTADRLRSETK